MAQNFTFVINDNLVKIINNKFPHLKQITIFINQQYILSILNAQQVQINTSYFTKPTYLTVQGILNANGAFSTVTETFNLNNNRSKDNREITYKPGDILIAADNVNGLPPGYMGHSALVVDSDSIVEVVGTDPIVRRSPISFFTEDHPMHAQFRPKSRKMGESAAKYAINYLNNFNYATQTSEATVPIFNFSLSTKLSDEWEYIYCSKLIWLSYYYGANYEFENDHLWFAPEDLYSLLKDNDDFETIYIHPDFKFKIDL